ncbi:hypothetical protein M1146_00730 [Patescibacteria group bacterium]|nr:hypothetical protein [Patescibacteria group bacterium]
MTIKQKIGAAIATGTLIAATLLPGAAFANTNITISGNGVGSVNKAKVVKINKSTVNQGNLTGVSVSGGALSNTGGNSASGNTGSGVTIGTGAAASSASTSVTGSSNVNTQGLPCGCDESSTTIDITRNGVGSNNRAKVVTINSLTVNQGNATLVGVETLVGSNTGGNSASGNTGGTVGITTGTANSSVGVSVTGSSNTN